MHFHLTIVRSNARTVRLTKMAEKISEQEGKVVEPFRIGTRTNREYGFQSNSKYLHEKSRFYKMPLRSYSTSSDIPPRDFNQEKLMFQRSDSQMNFSSYDSIPVKIDGHDLTPLKSFKDIDFGEIINLNIQLCGYDKPTPIQKYSLPYLMEKNDLIACAQTGSGKTVAFLLPIIQSIKHTTNSKDFRNKEPLSLILAPTRELVQQIVTEAKKLIYRTNLKVVGIFGGAPHVTQLKQLSSGCHIMVATPGRLIDFIKTGHFDLVRCQYLVIDEADRMLDMGFFPQIEQILSVSKIPDGDGRQTVMFSATFPDEVKKLAANFLRKEVKITVGNIGFNCEQIKQEIIQIEESEKDIRLIEILTNIKKENEKSQILIFVDRKRIVDDIEINLYKKGFRVVSIHGDRTQSDRNEALTIFRTKKADIMVATDVASRGIDIPSVSHVINYSFPEQIESYVHRIGRTGRCGNIGTAISFITVKDSNISNDLIKLLKENKQSIPNFLYTMRPYFSSNNQRSSFRGYRETSSNFYRERRNHDLIYEDY